MISQIDAKTPIMCISDFNILSQCEHQPREELKVRLPSILVNVKGQMKLHFWLSCGYVAIINLRLSLLLNPYFVTNLISYNFFFFLQMKVLFVQSNREINKIDSLYESPRKFLGSDMETRIRP